MNLMVRKQNENGRTPLRRAALRYCCGVGLGILLLLSGLQAEEPLIATPVEVSPNNGKISKFPNLFRRSKKPVQTNQRVPDEAPRYVAVPVFESESVKASPVRPITSVASIDSLPDLIAEALVNNPELQSVRQDEIIQLAKSEYTGKDAYPLIAAYGTHDSQPPSAFGVRNNLGGRSERDAFGLSAEQALLDWGENRGKIEMDRLQARSHHWNAKVKESEIVYKVSEAYWRVVFFKEVVSLRESAFEAKRRERLSVAARVEAREARSADLLLVEAGEAEAEHELFKAQNGHDLSTAQLLFYIGRQSNETVLVNDRLSLSKNSRPELVDVESHPEMKRVRAAEMAASTAERAARAGRLPKVIFRGQIEDSNSQEGAGTTNLVPDGTNYKVGGYVSVPIGRQWVAATSRLNEAYAKQIQLAADATTLNASLQLRVKDAQNRVEEAVNSVNVAGKIEMAATENLKLRKELALIKNATRADVAKAEKDYDEARIGVFKAIYDVKEARAHLDRELGSICQ